MCLLPLSEWIPQSRVYRISAVPAPLQPSPPQQPPPLTPSYVAQSRCPELCLAECMREHIHTRWGSRGLSREWSLNVSSTATEVFVFVADVSQLLRKGPRAQEALEKHFKNKFTRKEHFWKGCRKSGDLQTLSQRWNISKSFAGRRGCFPERPVLSSGNRLRSQASATACSRAREILLVAHISHSSKWPQDPRLLIPQTPQGTSLCTVTGIPRAASCHPNLVVLSSKCWVLRHWSTWHSAGRVQGCGAPLSPLSSRQRVYVISQAGESQLGG